MKDKMLKDDCKVCGKTYKYKEGISNPLTCSKRKCKKERDNVFEEVANKQQKLQDCIEETDKMESDIMKIIVSNLRSNRKEK